MTPFAVCHDIAQKNGSPLFLVSRLLGASKRRLFITAYAAMRVVDDLVDENFFASPLQERQMRRDQVLHQIGCWRQQAIDAAKGCFLPQADAFEPKVFIALNETIGVSDLGPWPWIALANAMEQDVNEQEIVSWEDFLAYCEGATVAPAATFAYILACEVRGGSAMHYRLDKNESYCQDHVREMAIFCYLIHIIRDLAKDVTKHEQLITIPREMLASAGLERATLAHSLDHRPAMETLIHALLVRAEQLLVTGQPTIAKLSLPSLEHMILQRLLNKYIKLFHQLKTNPTKFLARPLGGGEPPTPQEINY